MSFSSGLRHYTNLVFHRAYADFRAEAERTYLGVVWWVLEPLINMVIYYFVFGIFLGRGKADFVPFLLTGLVAWRFFDATVNLAGVSIMVNMTMVRQVSFKKLIFPIIAVLKCSFEFVFSLALLFTVLFIYGYWPTAHWLAFPVVLFVLLLFTLGFGLPLSSLIPFVPDLVKVVQYSLRIMFYMSGIMYSVADLSEKAQRVLRLNPAIPVIDGFRDVLMYHRWPSYTGLGVVAGLSCVGIVLGIYLNMRFDRIYAKRVAL